ncbi:MAG TPA: glycosyltransferase family 39 protein [Verrucomicrobiae bacterium]|nr:glycosyltransferase family 39 protein [Verrucomicrobiae bacterium]
MPGSIRHWMGSHPGWTLALVTIGTLLPFLSKPFNMDDPLFIWAAQQIHAHPANPYGFNIEWDVRQAPMWKVTENPPLTSYYIAGASAVVGWSEAALHFAFLVPAVAVILGTFRLARQFCNSPVLAALVTLFTPAFLVSSTTLMSDVPMLAFWTWALVFWVEGTEQKKSHKLLVACFLAGLAAVTKYYAVCLIPLLAAYSIVSRRPPAKWAPFLLIPLAFFLAGQFAMYHLYGLVPLFRATDYSLAGKGSAFVRWTTCLIGLAFTGGCLAPALFLTPVLWKKWSAAFLGVGILFACLVVFDPALLKQYPSLQPAAYAGAGIQLALWAATGISILALALSEIKASRDPKSVLLWLWMIGTFIFAVFLNWTINARSILPMAPALGILIARRLERNFTASFPIGKTAWCLAAGAALALYAAEADCLIAVAVKQNVRSIYAAYGPNIKQIHFQGHWGFQFYMSQLGALPLDFKSDILKPGDLIAISTNNSNILMPGPGKAVLTEIFSEPGPPFLTTLDEFLGAGFDSSILGPVPFLFGPVSPENVGIYSLR